MSRFIESICILKGEIRNLTFHQNRINQTRYKLLGLMDELNVSQLFQFSDNQRIGKFKCRIVYAESIEEFQMLPYQIRPIHSVRLVESNAIDYRFKLEDRKAFSYLKDAVNEDEIIIIQNGQITDTSYSNLVFFDGEKWITPTTYLLNGTMRQSLLQTKQIIEKPIQVEDLNRFESFKLINAMMDLEESPELPISIIV
ncbi:MAG: aminotransferase class IV [Weeksellaceae bacterium]